MSDRFAIGAATVAAVFSAVPAVVMLLTSGPSGLVSLFIFLAFLAGRLLAVCLVGLFLGPVLVITGLVLVRKTGSPWLFTIGVATAIVAVGFGLVTWPQIMPVIGWGGYGVLVISGVTAGCLFFRQGARTEDQRFADV